jgi:hypothetical protein
VEREIQEKMMERAVGQFQLLKRLLKCIKGKRERFMSHQVKRKEKKNAIPHSNSKT